jgi:hypothetical protein
MLTYTRRETDTLVRWKKRPLGVIEKQGHMWVWLPRACDRQVKWEFATLLELKQFLQSDSQIVLTSTP